MSEERKEKKSKKLTRSKTNLTHAMAIIWRSGGNKKLKNDTRRHTLSMNDMTNQSNESVMQEMRTNVMFRQQKKKSEENLDLEQIPADVDYTFNPFAKAAHFQQRHTFDPHSLQSTKVPTNYDASIGNVSGYHQSSSSKSTNKPNDDAHGIAKRMISDEDMSRTGMIDFIKSSQNYRDNKYNFYNVKKYKIDNQTSVKLTKNEVIEVERDQLLVKNSNVIARVLADKMADSTLEVKSPKEKVLIFPDKRIHLYWEKKVSMTSEGSPKSDNVKNRLMLFFKKRPVVAVLREKGIYKNETVFGNTLLQLELIHKTSVPTLVRKCIEIVEMPKNIITEGLYRSSASLATLQDIRFSINDNNSRDLSILDKYHNSPDVPSGLLKLFIRELKESLIREEDFAKLIAICSNNETHSLKYEAVLKVIEEMLIPHRDTLDVLLRHLNNVIQYESVNGMSTIGIAICWGQTMSSATDGVLMAKKKNEVTELLLMTYQAKYPSRRLSATSTPQVNEQISSSHGILSRQHSKDISTSQVREKNSETATSMSNLASRGIEIHKSADNCVVDKNTTSKSMHNLLSASHNAQTLVGHSGTANMSMVGNSQEGESIFQNCEQEDRFVSSGDMMTSNSESMDSVHVLGSMSNISSCSLSPDCFEASKHRVNFMKELMLRIENLRTKGTYKGKGSQKIVQKIINKSKKEKSKELGKLMNKADVFILGDVLEAVVKEFPFILDFNQMEVLVENKDKKQIKEILNGIPEYIALLFGHFRKLINESEEALTILGDIYERWWPILVAKPGSKSAGERVGVNLNTFERLMIVIVEQGTIKKARKWVSMNDLKLLNNYCDQNKVCPGDTLCCSKSNTNRYTSCYSLEE